jgi:hypothetical protein
MSGSEFSGRPDIQQLDVLVRQRLFVSIDIQLSTGLRHIVAGRYDKDQQGKQDSCIHRNHFSNAKLTIPSLP